MPETMEGRKDDQGKDPWHLFPWDAARAIVKVLDFGQKKYAPRNWEKGMDWDRPFSACVRHLTAWHEGEHRDPETGLSHLWHAGCCILFLIAYEIRQTKGDNRPCTVRDQTWAQSAVSLAEKPKSGLASLNGTTDVRA